MKNTNLILGLIFTLNLFGQTNYHECQIIQINAQDISKKHISLFQKLDNYGNLIYEKYQGYLTDHQNGRTNGEYFYRYTDNKLVEKLFVERSKIDEGFDTTKTTLTYKKEKLITEKNEKFILRGNKKQKGCTSRFPEDFLPRQCYLIGVKKYFYNKNGLLIEEYTLKSFIYHKIDIDTTMIWRVG